MTTKELNERLAKLKSHLNQLGAEFDNLIREYNNSPEPKTIQEELDPQYPPIQKRLLPDAIKDLNKTKWEIDNPIHYKRYQRLKGSIRNSLILSKVDRMPFGEEPKWDLEMLKTLDNEK